MKMKLTIFMVIMVIVTVNPAILQAQETYYQMDASYTDGEINYRCDIDLEIIATLYNLDNTYTYKPVTFLNGSDYSAVKHGPSFSMSYESVLDIENRINDAFSSEQIKNIKDWGVNVNIIIDPKTGKVIEVFYRVNNRSPLNLIPPSIFHQIDLNFLSGPIISGLALTEVGRKLNFIKLTWDHEFK